MRYALLAVALLGAATLGGCTEGVLDPKGPIAAAERQILLNSTGIMLSIVIPTMLATLGVAWVGSYELDPPKPLASSVKPVRIQVVSLDWKWLFVYPDQGIASVNRLTVPAGTPVS